MNKVRVTLTKYDIFLIGKALDVYHEVSIVDAGDRQRSRFGIASHQRINQIKKKLEIVYKEPPDE